MRQIEEISKSIMKKTFPYATASRLWETGGWRIGAENLTFAAQDVCYSNFFSHTLFLIASSLLPV